MIKFATQSRGGIGGASLVVFLGNRPNNTRSLGDKVKVNVLGFLFAFAISRLHDYIIRQWHLVAVVDVFSWVSHFYSGPAIH